MVGLGLTVLVVGIVMLLLGVFVHAASFLIWLGIVVAIVGAVLWLFHAFSGGRRTTTV
jgi:hypothetical protein